jgi:hypothetical protein
MGVGVAVGGLDVNVGFVGTAVAGASVGVGCTGTNVTGASVGPQAVTSVTTMTNAAMLDLPLSFIFVFPPASVTLCYQQSGLTITRKQGMHKNRPAVRRCVKLHELE